MFLSSLEDVKDKARGFEVGGNDYLTKPFEVLEVKARVRSLLKAKAYADAVKAAAERDLRIAREIQMGLLPANVAGADPGHRPRRARRARTGAPGRRRSLRGPAARPRPRARRGRRRVGQGHSRRAVHGGGDDAPAQPGAAGQSARGDPASAERRAAGTEPARDVRDPAVPGVRSRGAAGHVRQRRTPRRDPNHARAAAAAGLHIVRTRARIDARRATSPARRWQLQAGDTLVLFTDGVSEAFDVNEELFGEERLLAHLEASPAAARARRRWACSRRCAGTRQARSSRTTSRSFPSATPAERERVRHPLSTTALRARATQSNRAECDAGERRDDASLRGHVRRRRARDRELEGQVGG